MLLGILAAQEGPNMIPGQNTQNLLTTVSVCVCVGAYAYVHMYTCTYVHMYMYTRNTCIPLYKGEYIHIYFYIQTYTSTYTHIHMSHISICRVVRIMVYYGALMDPQLLPNTSCTPKGTLLLTTLYIGSSYAYMNIPICRYISL